MAEIPVNGVRLYYEEHGQGDPILCIHGTASSAMVWRPAAIEDLSGLGRVIVYAAGGVLAVVLLIAAAAGGVVAAIFGGDGAATGEVCLGTVTNPGAIPGPLYMPQYHPPALARSAALDAAADNLYTQGTDAKDDDDHYILSTVFFAAVLFLAALVRMTLLSLNPAPPR